MTAATLVPVALLLRRSPGDESRPAAAVALENPFSLTSAVKFALLFAVVLLVVAGVRRYYPGQGFYVVAALAGLTDVDAITLSMASLARDGGADLATAARSIVIAALSNTVVKCGIIVATAAAVLRRRVLAVAALAVLATLLALAIA
jgi:uncharacterized membrane protein (DUF4010 family)